MTRRCPFCGTEKPTVVEENGTGFTGAPIFWSTYSCCGKTDLDDSRDTLDWVR